MSSETAWPSACTSTARRPGALRSCLLPPVVGVQLVRIVQEALTNVRKHAERSRTRSGCNCRLRPGSYNWRSQTTARVSIPAQPGTDPEHFGLQVMRQRAERIGGRLAVHSLPGEGTRVEVCMPLRQGGEGEETWSGNTNYDI